MDHQVIIELTSRDLADALGLEIVGPEISIRALSLCPGSAILTCASVRPS